MNPVRSKAVVDSVQDAYAKSLKDSLLLHFEMWKAARAIVLYIVPQLAVYNCRLLIVSRPFAERVKQAGIGHTVLIPEAKRSHQLICKTVKRFDITLLVMGTNGRDIADDHDR